MDITTFLADYYPSLIPESHKTVILDSLHDLHALNYFSLSFPDRPQVAHGFKAAVERRLEGNISDRYREALKYKLSV